MWHYAFSNRVLIKHASITKLTKCILREQSRFEIDIERLRAGKQLKKKKKIYANFDARLKRIVLFLRCRQYRRIFNSDCYELEHKHLNLLK